MAFSNLRSLARAIRGIWERLFLTSLVPPTQSDSYLEYGLQCDGRVEQLLGTRI